jgi:3-deoxy-manno-octulosonate cytidylyltransferase (CMP-KDO synthetase)
LPFTLTESSVVAIIPARYDSTRFPGKILADLAGRPMIEHVYRRASSATKVHGTIVATDDLRIAEAVQAFGGAAVMTRRDHVSGTDRIAEVMAELPCNIVVNVQGDEPLIEPDTIDAATVPLLEDPSIHMTTLSRPFAGEAEISNPHVVKVVTDTQGRALYFSRSPLPTARAHIGLYGYRREALLRLAGLPPAPAELAERLEQLRALFEGMIIKVVPTTHVSIGVDTPDDLERVRQRLLASSRTRD